MATIFKAQRRTIILENVTHIQAYPDATLLFPANFYTLRLAGEEAEKAVELAKTAGFVGNDELLINPLRLVVAEEDQATARLMMDGYAKQIIVPAKFLAYLEPEPAPVPAPVSSAGKSSKKKSAE